jgi:hypothetical protein
MLSRIMLNLISNTKNIEILFVLIKCKIFNDTDQNERNHFPICSSQMRFAVSGIAVEAPMQTSRF